MIFAGPSAVNHLSGIASIKAWLEYPTSIYKDQHAHTKCYTKYTTGRCQGDAHFWLARTVEEFKIDSYRSFFVAFVL